MTVQRRLNAILCGSAARALIPDDDDEELIEKAKANRKQRLAEQRETAKEFSKVEGFNSAELVSVQRAINKLARSAAELEAGNLPAVVAVCEYGSSALRPCPWVLCPQALPLGPLALSPALGREEEGGHTYTACR